MAIVLTLSSLATLGLEKYALLRMPVLIERKSWERLRGLLRFSFRAVTFTASALALLAVLCIESVLTAFDADFHLGIPIAIVFLPIMTWGLFLVEGLTALGKQKLAAMLYRIALPCLFLLVNLGFILVQPESFSAIQAALAFGLAWTLITIVLGKFFHRARPAETLDGPCEMRTSKWLKNALPLLTYGLILTAQGQAGVLVLDLLFPSDPRVSEYAIAWSIGTFLLLVATATNRFYLPVFSVHIERRSLQGFVSDWRVRRWWIALIVLPFTFFIGFFGEHVLGIFGTDYVRATPALVIIVASSSVAVIFAPAPYILQMLGKGRTVLSLAILSLTATIAGSVYFGTYYGVTGIAVSYAVPLSIQYTMMKLMMLRVVARKLKPSI